MPEEVAQTTIYPETPTPEIKEMIDAGVFYGRKKTKTNPKMKGYVLLNRGGVEVINLAESAVAMEHASGFLREKMRHGCLVLFVATQPAAEVTVTDLAKKFGMPYAVTCWPGGAITNFSVISKRVDYMKKLRSDLARGAMDKYTKKERVMLDRELGRLADLFGGMESMSRTPDVLVVVDPSEHHTAVREANKKKIPVVALGNVDTDPDLIDYLVPGNDSAKSSIGWFLNKIEEAIMAGLKEKTEQTPSTNNE